MARDRQRHFFWRKLQAGDGGGEGKNKNGLPAIFFFDRVISGLKKITDQTRKIARINYLPAS
jgi:hypothetical protein